ncbi:MAG: hypothetical protein HY941_00570 [Gammaproteobacteria bacterium]|nr:hypothetical protein [Gammaproteobacteria bacterium]
MLNPAWQPAQEHAERLIHISHHFLSDNIIPQVPQAPQVTQVPHAPAADLPAAEPVVIPVLLAVAADMPQRQDPGYLLRALARQLNLPSSAASEHPERDERAGRAERDWHLQTCAHAGEIAQASPLVVLMIDATLDATREAYGLLKQANQRQIENVGVIFRAGDDLAAARRCYRRLAVGALRFLDRPLVNLGWLPNPGPHFAAALAHAAQVIHSQRHERAPQEPTRGEVMQ